MSHSTVERISTGKWLINGLTIDSTHWICANDLDISCFAFDKKNIWSFVVNNTWLGNDSLVNDGMFFWKNIQNRNYIGIIIIRCRNSEIQKFEIFVI